MVTLLLLLLLRFFRTQLVLLQIFQVNAFMASVTLNAIILSVHFITEPVAGVSSDIVRTHCEFLIS